MKAHLTTEMTPKGYWVRVFVNNVLQKAVYTTKRLKFIIFEERWQEQVNQFNELCQIQTQRRTQS
jgi:hypothetical protein